jgi:hypothetical protein
MRISTRKSVVAIGTTAALVAVTGIAYAYYATTVSGTGTGGASVASAAPAALTFAASTVTGLTPGGTVNATVTFTNPNAFAVGYPAKTVAVQSVSGPTGCATNAVAKLSGSGSLIAGVLAAGGTVPVTVPVTMEDSLTVDQSSCAGGTFTITYSAS